MITVFDALSSLAQRAQEEGLIIGQAGHLIPDCLELLQDADDIWCLCLNIATKALEI